MSKEKTMFLQFLTCVSLLTLASAFDVIPGCRSKCGNVSITYPFGVGEESCYHEKEFELVCNTSFSSPVLYSNGLPVIDVSFDGTMTVSLGVTYDCYDKYGSSTSKAQWRTLLSDHFTFSNTKNMFTAIGCDTEGIMQDSNEDIFRNGCTSICRSQDEVIEGSCSGIGCCQTAIPKGLKTLNLSLSSLYNHRYSWTYNPCSYAFFVDYKQFNFSRVDLLNLAGRSPKVKNELSFPAVLDWVIGTETCEEATTNIINYACMNNSVCLNSKNGPGYTCNCTEGYEGNPYFADGCKDIDECLAPKSPCGKFSICTNTAGGYNCFCPRGYINQNEKDCIKANKLPILRLGLGIGFGFLFLFAVLFGAIRALRERNLIQRKAKFFQQNGGSLLKRRISTFEGNEGSSCIFTAEELVRATHNYNEILGQGGFGAVYKGILSDKRVVAIKKSNIFDKNQNEQFINEFFILSQVSHPNVVKLYGCCLETEVPLLVYEYVSNGNLFQHIHENKGGFSISWNTRLRVAAETAKALAYLHDAFTFPIIHRDVKSTNILFDDSLNAKVADFGISKPTQLDQSQMSTIVQESSGYLDPEYLHTSQLTEKSDVYSFGVVLLELLTRMKPVCSNRSPVERNLANHFKEYLKQNRLFHIVDPQIINEGNPKQIESYSRLAKRCLRWKGEQRPTMEEVAKELEKLSGFEMHLWIPQTNEENQNLISDETTSQDVYSIELSSYTGGASS